MKILVITCMLLATMCQAKKTSRMNLNMKVNRLSRVTDVLQKDVSDIWTIISNSGIENLEFGNKTRTDSDNLNQEGKADIDEGKENKNEIKEFKTEVKQLIQNSRIGFKNEKEFQREAIDYLNSSWKSLESSLTGEYTGLRQNVERLDINVSDLQETYKNNEYRIEMVNYNLNETAKKVESHDETLEFLLKKVESLSETNKQISETNKQISETNKQISEKQKTLEIENRALKQTISDMQEDITMLPIRIVCDKDWIPHNTHCYYFNIVGKSWDDAIANCKSKNSHLLEITSDSKFDSVMKYIWSYLSLWFNSRIWIGAKYQQFMGTFVYQTSKEVVPNKFWATGEPNNSGGKEYCVIMENTNDHKFYDFSCESKLPYLCEKRAILVPE